MPYYATDHGNCILVRMAEMQQDFEKERHICLKVDGLHGSDDISLAVDFQWIFIGPNNQTHTDQQ